MRYTIAYEYDPFAVHMWHYWAKVYNAQGELIGCKGGESFETARRAAVCMLLEARDVKVPAREEIEL